MKRGERRMATNSARLTVRPESDLSLVLRQAVAAGEPVIVDTGEAVYELDVFPATDPDAAVSDGTEPDAILGIIGIGSSEEPTTIARDKDRYLAEAFDPRPPR
jgi:hypothetical protein